MKKLLLILLFVSITACENKSQVTYLNKEQVSYKVLSDNSTCLKLIKNSSLLNETIIDFINISKVKTNNKTNRLIFMFLIEEGEIINTYKTAILYSKNNKIISKKNREQIQIKELKDFKVNKILKYLTSVNNDKEITNTELLVFDMQTNETKCYFRKNINEQIIYEIKNNIIR